MHLKTESISFILALILCMLPPLLNGSGTKYVTVTSGFSPVIWPMTTMSWSKVASPAVVYWPGARNTTFPAPLRLLPPRFFGVEAVEVNRTASPWVDEEVRYFVANGRAERIIPFIVDGEPDSEDPALECFPPALRSTDGHTHLGANIQEIGKDKAFLKTVSILLGVRFGRLVDREKQRRLRTALITTAVIAVIASVGGALLWRNAVISRKNRELNYDIYGAALVSLSQKDVMEPEDFAFLTASAEQGNTTAMFYLSDCYKKGWGVEQDPAQEFYWSKKGAELGDPLCMIALSNCYFYGEGTEQDYQEALAWDLKAAETGSASGMLGAAICYEEGLGVEADPARAVELYRECAEADPARFPSRS